MPNLPIVIIRWYAFRVMFSAGIVKWRGSENWRKLTAMVSHYLTQPIPIPTSRFFYESPVLFHKFETLLSLIVEIPLCIVLVLIPSVYLRYLAGISFVGLMVMINVSGYFGYLGLLMSFVSCSLFDDNFLLIQTIANITNDKLVYALQEQEVSFGLFDAVRLVLMLGLAAAAFYVLAIYLILGIYSLCRISNKISICPSFFGKLWGNYCHTGLVNDEGFFSIMTEYRWEIIVEGSEDLSNWKRYEFLYKPSHPDQKPPWNVFYYWPRLDWMLWILPLRVRPFLEAKLDNPADFNPVWMNNFLRALLQGNKAVLALLKSPFSKPPKYVRARLFDYRFAPSDPAKVKTVQNEAYAFIRLVVEGSSETRQGKNVVVRQESNEALSKHKLKVDNLFASMKSTVGKYWIETGPICDYMSARSLEGIIKNK